MFPRLTRVRSGDKTYQYLQILESYGENGRSRQRVVTNPGRLDLLGEKLDRLMRSLRKYCQGRFVLAEEISSLACGLWGRSWWPGICGTRWA